VPHKNFNIMKKHFKAYVEGFDGAKELRINLMESQNAKGAIGVLKNFLKN
jgi:tRNA-dihydrouridine synthase